MKKVINTLFTSMAFAALSAVAIGVSAQTAPATGAKTEKAAATADLTDAVVRKVDKEQGKVTLKHEAIKNLDMPPMTMVFAVRDKAMLDTVKTGDKVRFKAVDDNGKIVVMELTAAK
ncbi:MAG: copper-binding protein [Burkholderiaceae bacterium]